MFKNILLLIYLNNNKFYCIKNILFYEFYINKKILFYEFYIKNFFFEFKKKIQILINLKK